MSTEIRFLLAVVLMIGVLVITNLMFPPTPLEEQPGYIPPDSVQPAEVPRTEAPSPGQDSMGVTEVTAEGLPAEDPLEGVLGDTEPVVPEPTEAEGSSVLVEGPLYTFTFSTRGARLVSARLPNFPSFVFDGPVELFYPQGGAALGIRLLSGPDTVDMRGLDFQVEPADGLRLAEGGEPQDLTFTYRHP